MGLAKDNNLAYGWTGWSVRRNSMAVQMPNLGILDSWILWIMELLLGTWNLWVLGPYWNLYWDIRVFGLWIPYWSRCCNRHNHPCWRFAMDGVASQGACRQRGAYVTYRA